MGEMTAAGVLTDLLEQTGTSQRKLAESLGISPQLLNNRMIKNTFPAADWIEAVLALGFDIKVVPKDGAEVKVKARGSGPRVSQMVDGVVYDTEKAEAICNSKDRSGSELFMELFRDTKGRFFVVYYQLWEGGRNSISPVSRGGAQFFMRRYGIPGYDL